MSGVNPDACLMTAGIGFSQTVTCNQSKQEKTNENHERSIMTRVQYLLKQCLLYILFKSSNVQV